MGADPVGHDARAGTDPWVIGYALVLLPATSGAVYRAFAEAGSSMFTLGYAAPTNTSSTALDYLAAYTGLVVVGLQIGYLPTLYAAFNRRETQVTLLISRAGVPAWGPEISQRFSSQQRHTAAAIATLTIVTTDALRRLVERFRRAGRRVPQSR